MYASNADTMSVNDNMANLSFASYLRDCMNNQPNSPCRHIRTRLAQPLPLQTINNSQTALAPYCGPVFKPIYQSAPCDRHLHLRLPFNMTAEAQAYFKEYISDPEALYLPPNITTFYHTAPVSSSLWTSGTYQPDYAVASPPHPFKIDNSPAPLPVPGVLPRNVDVSKYENLSYDDWYIAPTSYQSSTSPSTGYAADSPALTDDMFSEYSSSFGSNSNMEYYTSANPVYSHGPRSIPSMTYPTSFAPSSLPSHTTHDPPPGYPYINHATSSQHDGHTTLAQFHHHYMIEGSLSPQSLGVRTSVEAEEDSEYEESPASSPSPRYVLADDEIDARNRRDGLLLSMRDEGKSYREIKRLGKFKEAESTLRGRYRALTKGKEERVRKPQWHRQDVGIF